MRRRKEKTGEQDRNKGSEMEKGKIRAESGRIYREQLKSKGKNQEGKYDTNGKR